MLNEQLGTRMVAVARRSVPGDFGGWENIGASDPDWLKAPS
jgi:hypothetical protein